MHRIFIFLITLLSYSYNQENDTSTEYIIYTSSELMDSAELLKNFYNNPEIYGYSNSNILDISLKTEIVTTNMVSPQYFKSYLFDNYSNFNGAFSALKYLLILGDETIIEPLKYLNIVASDDYFSSILSSQSTFPILTISTGRLLVKNSNEALNNINAIINYITDVSEGSWKSESLLIADDIYKNGKEIYEEIIHTEYSDSIYNRLKDNMNVSCLYGNEFARYQSSDWYIQPEVNNNIVQKINNGLSIVNYIGHGTSSILADEDILTASDINQISIQENKLPIWIVGTCSFGNYLNENCLSEQLLNKGNTAIAIISTTYNVSYDSNWNFLNNLYSNIESYLNNENNHFRLGDQVFYSKQKTGNNAGIDYKFHLFGDPAMPIKIAKSTNNLVNPIQQIDVANFNTLNVDNNALSTVKIILEDKIKNINYLDENNISKSLSYNIPGEILFYNAFYNSTDYILPLNINTNNKAIINIHNDYENTFQNISNINLSISEEFDFNNDTGPSITITHKGKEIFENDTIYPPYDVKVFFEDTNPINLSGLNDNNLRLWINDDENNILILNDLFIPIDSQNTYKGYVEINLMDYLSIDSDNNIKVQAWDILGKNNVLNLNFKTFNNELVYNVYNFPNPFNNTTNFTFHYSEKEAVNVEINIYTINGFNVKTITQENITPSNSTFYKISQKWDGKDNNNNDLSNGTYIYKLSIYQNADNKLIHEGIYKASKVK